MLLNCGVVENSWESHRLQGDQTSQSQRKSVLSVHWKDWCWSWNSNILASWSEELTHLKRPWYCERLRAGGERDDRGWDGWMASPTQWTWVWVDSGSWWWTGMPGVLRFLVLQRLRLDWATELNWTEHLSAQWVFKQCHGYWNWCCCSVTKLCASGSFPVSWLFASDGQSIGASASVSILQWIFRVDFL